MNIYQYLPKSEFVLTNSIAENAYIMAQALARFEDSISLDAEYLNNDQKLSKALNSVSTVSLKNCFINPDQDIFDMSLDFAIEKAIIVKEKRLVKLPYWG